MPRKGGKRKKSRTHKEEVDEDVEFAPKSFIIKRGKIGMYTKELLQDMRDLMYPYTAQKLKESKKNAIKDFISVAGVFGVTHMMIFSQTDKSTYLRCIKNPKGPTITFKVDQYSLAKDVIKYQQSKRNSKIFDKTLQSAPLLIMNGFQGKEENDAYRIVSLMIQSMFPPIKVQSMNLSKCKRVVLFNLMKNAQGEDEGIEFRHYGISARQRSINRSIKKIINNKKVPNLSRYNDIADYLLSQGKGAYTSESEADDIPESRIILPEDFQDKKKNTSVAIKLHELGPRLRLKLVKIEEGLCRGNVVYHSYIKKSKKEIKNQMDDIKKKRELKAERKRIQDENVERKQIEKDKKRGVKFTEENQEGNAQQEGQEEDLGDVDIDETQDKRVLGKNKYDKKIPAKKGFLGKRQRSNK